MTANLGLWVGDHWELQPTPQGPGHGMPALTLEQHSVVKGIRALTPAIAWRVLENGHCGAQTPHRGPLDRRPQRRKLIQDRERMQLLRGMGLWGSRGK